MAKLEMTETEKARIAARVAAWQAEQARSTAALARIGEIGTVARGTVRLWETLAQLGEVAVLASERAGMAERAGRAADFREREQVRRARDEQRAEDAREAKLEAADAAREIAVERKRTAAGFKGAIKGADKLAALQSAMARNAAAKRGAATRAAKKATAAA